MKIRKTYRIFALSMSLLLLLSSVGISADFHFCQGEFKNLALFKKAKSCHEIAAMQAACLGSNDKVSSCHKSAVKCNSEQEDGCCNNNTKLLQLDIDYSFGGIAITQSPDFQKDLAILTLTQRLDFSTSTYPSQFQKYKPPMLVKNLRVQYQSFLC